MMRIKILLITFSVLFGFLRGGVYTIAEQSTATPQIKLEPCEIRGIEGDSRCGSLDVFENRTTKEGRKITLKVLVLLATGPNRVNDPLFYIPGGPGSSAIEDSPGIAAKFARIREKRDLVFLDQRGTGGSHPLDCALFDPEDVHSYLGYFFPLEAVKKCRLELEKKADLTLYTTSIAMDDLDDVRAALGYQQINIFGGSYGTRASLVYLRQHPSRVRSMALQGAFPTTDFTTNHFAASNERALQGVIAECNADERCRKAYPNLSASLKTVLTRLRQGPVEVEIRYRDPRVPAGNPDATKPVKIKLSRDLAAEAVRYLLYNSGGAGRVPMVIHQAAKGDYQQLAQAAVRYRQFLVATGSNGMYLSVTCAEDLPWIRPADVTRESANTFLGDYRFRQQREACALWPQANLSPNFSKPITGTAPVLILTGEWDPVTPPSNGDEVARHLSNSLHLVVPHGAHGLGDLEGGDCLDRLLESFVENGSTKGLDITCVTQIKRKPFAVRQ